jgi:hypothetical protein
MTELSAGRPLAAWASTGKQTVQNSIMTAKRFLKSPSNQFQVMKTAVSNMILKFFAEPFQMNHG